MERKNLIIIGNWKMNKTLSETEVFLKELQIFVKENASKIFSSTKFGIAAPAINLGLLHKKKIKSDMLVVAQDVHFKEAGAYTGDLSARMIKDVGANAVIIGHSERRSYHFETDKIVNKKIKAALAAELLPIICIGEKLSDREGNSWKSVLTKQVKGALKGFSPEEVGKMVIAYEPIWAIGTGKTATAKQAQEACQHIRNRIAASINQVAASKILIQYGGSVQPTNIVEILGKEDIDGVLVGGASLDPQTFGKLLTLNK